MCQERGKTWNGADPKCAFPYGVFVSDNWNCATANALRDIAGEGLCHEDQHAAIIKAGMDHDGFFVALEWYKSRGRTDGIWMMRGDETPRRITIYEAEDIIKESGRGPITAGTINNETLNANPNRPRLTWRP